MRVIGTELIANRTGTKVATVWRWALEAAVLAALVSFVLACARVQVAEMPSPQPTQGAKSDAEVLRERAQAYWQARLKDDMVTAYTFEAPTYRKQSSLNDYVRSVGSTIKFTAADVSEVKINGDLADVYVEVQGRYMIPGWDTIPMKRTLHSDWQRIDGQWVHVLDFHLFRPGKPRINPDGTVTYIPETASPARTQ